jgi:hypothetical protein
MIYLHAVVLWAAVMLGFVVTHQSLQAPPRGDGIVIVKARAQPVLISGPAEVRR